MKEPWPVASCDGEKHLHLKCLSPLSSLLSLEIRIPFICVTHGAGELTALCDEVVALESGRQHGTPDQARLGRLNVVPRAFEASGVFDKPLTRIFLHKFACRGER
jgi:ABC-type molybdate transport system ATPase subunit